MAYIKLENGEIIDKGNFTFIYDITGSIELFNQFFEAERVFKLSYVDFAHKIRLAYEAFAIFEECKFRKSLPEFLGMTLEDISSIITKEITTPASVINYKSIMFGLCRDKAIEFKAMLLKYNFAKKINSDLDSRRAIKMFIKYIYDFGSKSSHVNKQLDMHYVPNRENCLRVLASFHDFLATYYSTTHKFDSTMIPIRDYLPVSKKICENMSLKLEAGKHLFVKEKENRIVYYIFSSDMDTISLSQRRDIDTINKLWEDNFGDPSNIIRQVEYISGCDENYKYQVYSFPGRPLKINSQLLGEITNKDKLDIIKGICQGILSMHEYEPPFYHRNICPDAFYIFKVKGKYKALLACFDCTKDNSEDASFTVLNNVEKKMLNKNISVFFAPEVINNKTCNIINWEKADIYALAQTCLYILTGNLVRESNNYITSIENCDIEDDIKIILLEMLSEDPCGRPKIDRVIDVLDNRDR